jgi:FkbM family methyltransferase
LKPLVTNRFRVRFPRGPVLTGLESGEKIWVWPNDLIGRNIFYGGLWEPEVASHFRAVLEPGDRVLDVGANVGQYTLLAASVVGETGAVFAVEPNNHVADVLESSIRANGMSNVRLWRFAAWHEATTLYLDGGDTQNMGAASTRRDPSGAHRCSVPARRLDDALREAGIDAVDVIKIDIEGAELPAFDGLDGILRTSAPRALYCELADRTEAVGYSPRDVVARLAALGYSGWILDDCSLRPVRAEAVGRKDVTAVFARDAGVVARAARACGMSFNGAAG